MNTPGELHQMDKLWLLVRNDPRTEGAPVDLRPGRCETSPGPVSGAGRNISFELVGAGGSVTGARPVQTNASGLSSFNDIAISGTGTFRLRFVSPGLRPDDSNEIVVN